ncbi:MAG: hypothetical protein WCK58_12145 [Chloroflexota bacterium]
MNRILVVSGTLGLGIAVVFGLAAITSALFPNGSTVAASWNGSWGGGWAKPGIAVPMPAPVPMPGLDGGSGTVTITNDQVITLK